MSDTRTVNSAQKVNDEQDNYMCIKAVINGVECV